MSAPRVVVVGGGLAGLQAALACSDRGGRVLLLEARPRLGGATFSFRRAGLAMDNGQHVFMRCCTAYRALLDRLGVADRVALQRRLAVPVLAPGGRVGWLRRPPGLPAPLHLAPSLLGFPHLPLRERLRIAAAARRLASLPLGAPALDRQSFGAWLAAAGQSEIAIARFWELVARPTLNLPAADASLALATMVFQTGFLASAGAADLGVASVPLDAVHADPAARELTRSGAEVRLRARVSRFEAALAGGRPAVWAGGERIEADAVVAALPHAEAAALLPPVVLGGRPVAALGASPIVNLHLVYDRRVMPFPFAAGVGTPVEWVFDRSRAAGLESGQYLVVSLSAADAYVGMAAAALRERFEPELARVFPTARDARLLHFSVTCERTATFRGEPGSEALRPPPGSGAGGIFLAGAWTATGWPATMEGAVRSGLAAAEAALRYAVRSARARTRAAARRERASASATVTEAASVLAAKRFDPTSGARQAASRARSAPRWSPS